VIPFVVFISLEDIRKKMNVPFWKRFFASFTVLFVAVLAFSKQITGQWFFLLRSVEQHHNDVFVNPKAQELLTRLTVEPLAFLFSQTGYWPLLLMAWPAFFMKNENLNYWKKYVFLLFLLLWFGTTSFQRWAPLPLLDRMWMMMVVPLSIMASHSIWALLQNRFSLKIKSAFYLAFIISAMMALPVFHFWRMLLFLMFPFFILLAEKRMIIKSGTLANLLMVLLPYVILAMWFTGNNSNW
jgi:hypothetical protein